MTCVSDFLSRGGRIKVRAKYECSASPATAEKIYGCGKKAVVTLAQPPGGEFEVCRQHPLGDRIVDFFCSEAKLAIELHGSGHASYRGQTSDLDREIDLYEKGIRVLRFQNTDVFNNLDGVLNAIIYAVDPERSLWR